MIFFALQMESRDSSSYVGIIGLLFAVVVSVCVNGGKFIVGFCNSR